MCSGNEMKKSDHPIERVAASIFKFEAKIRKAYRKIAGDATFSMNSFGSIFNVELGMAMLILGAEENTKNQIFDTIFGTFNRTEEELDHNMVEINNYVMFNLHSEFFFKQE